MIKAEFVDKDVWLKYDSEIASISSFGERRPKGLERIDSVIVSFYNESPTGYIQCIEMDAETLYWQYGGALSGVKKSTLVVPCYKQMIECALEKYKRITTRIENKNLAMLKIALKFGFIIQGVWNFKNKIYLELCLEKGV